jgi:hypothetical protein
MSDLRDIIRLVQMDPHARGAFNVAYSYSVAGVDPKESGLPRQYRRARWLGRVSAIAMHRAAWPISSPQVALDGLNDLAHDISTPIWTGHVQIEIAPV